MNVPNGFITRFDMGSGSLGVKNLGSDFNNGSSNLFPNPAKNIVNIDLGTNHKSINYINIYDITGKILNNHDKIGEAPTFQIDISNLSQWVYFAEIIDADGYKLIKKFIKE